VSEGQRSWFTYHLWMHLWQMHNVEAWPFHKGHKGVPLVECNLKIWLLCVAVANPTVCLPPSIS